MANPSKFTLDTETLIEHVATVPPVLWVDWWFRMQTSEAKERLRLVLFDPVGDRLRNLRSAEVREGVINCMQESEELRNIVHSDLMQRASALNSGEEILTPKFNADTNFCYKCGLRPGDRVILHREFPVRNHAGKIIHTHPIGEVWLVLGPSSDRTIVWLRQPDGDPHTWSDNESVFDYFQRVNP